MRSNLFLLLILATLASCGSYRQNILFRVPEGHEMKQQVRAAESNYVIQKNDLLKLSVYTNNGELIIDPEYRLLKELPTQSSVTKPDHNYLVDVNGVAKLPMVGELKVEGLTIKQAESILQKEYAQYYKDVFVRLEFLNKRIIVLGAPGGRVIPLTNESITLVEVLALAEGIGNDAKAHNIRVIRNEEVFVVDLSTIAGYQKTNMVMQPGDIVYVEPIRRPVSEAVRDYGPIISIVTSLTTLMVVIFGVN